MTGDNRGSIMKGIGLGILVSLAGTIALGTIAFGSGVELLFMSFLFIGATQLIWIVPLVFRRWRNEKETAKGVIIVASTIALLNAACWGLMANVRIAG